MELTKRRNAYNLDTELDIDGVKFTKNDQNHTIAEFLSELDVAKKHIRIMVYKTIY